MSDKPLLFRYGLQSLPDGLSGCSPSPPAPVQADLHSVFQYYCLIDTAFARHWPPKLTLVGWLALMKDVGATVLVPGTRTRADNTLSVSGSG